MQMAQFALARSAFPFYARTGARLTDAMVADMTLRFGPAPYPPACAGRGRTRMAGLRGQRRLAPGRPLGGEPRRRRPGRVAVRSAGARRALHRWPTSRRSSGQGRTRVLLAGGGRAAWLALAARDSGCTCSPPAPGSGRASVPDDPCRSIWPTRPGDHCPRPTPRRRPAVRRAPARRQRSRRGGAR